MEPVSVAAGAVTALVPYLAEAGKAAAGEVGKSTWAGAKKLWTLLQSLLEPVRQTQVINGNDNNAVQAVGSTVHIGGR